MDDNSPVHKRTCIDKCFPFGSWLELGENVRIRAIKDHTTYIMSNPTLIECSMLHAECSYFFKCLPASDGPSCLWWPTDSVVLKRFNPSWTWIDLEKLAEQSHLHIGPPSSLIKPLKLILNAVEVGTHCRQSAASASQLVCLVSGADEQIAKNPNQNEIRTKNVYF